jgi:hypothetical protein
LFLKIKSAQPTIRLLPKTQVYKLKKHQHKIRADTTQ